MKLIDLNFTGMIKDNHSYENLQKLKLPNKDIEEFKRFDLSDLYEFEYEFNINQTLDSLVEEYTYLKNDDFYTIFISNSKFVAQHSIINSDIDFSSHKKNDFYSNNALYYLSETFLKEQNNLTIKKSLDRPLLIVNLFQCENSFIPISLNINLEKNCTADILEIFISKNKDNSFININRFFSLNQSATLNYTKLEEFTNVDNCIFNYNSNIKKAANLNITTLDCNAKKSLNLWDFDLKNEEISLSLNAIVNINQNKQSANIAHIQHNNKNISSEVNIQHILDDKSSSVFDIKSTINNNAQYAKVLQSSKTILLSDDAKINAQPRLQIYTDELEARHSATSGAINQEQVYYLTSRGIPKKRAMQMIIESYELKVINKIENSLIREFVKNFRGKSNV